MRPNQLLPTAMGALLLTLPLAACGSVLNAGGNPLSTKEFEAAVAEVMAAGKPAYYLGSEVGDLPLTSLDLVEENAPAFQVEADYGTCASTGDGGCSAPVVVSTNDWHPDVQGLTCTRLEPQLGVPTGVLMGELTLATGAPCRHRLRLPRPRPQRRRSSRPYAFSHG